MRILLTNNHLVQPGGTETWTRAMARHLVAVGHVVDVLALNTGPFAESFPCRVLTAPDGRYELGLVNHNTCMQLARASCDQTVFTSHGVYPDLEQPTPGANHYVAVSEEVAAHLLALGYSATVIRNAIDPHEFADGPPISRSLSRVLSLCQGAGAAYEVSVACIHLGVEYRICGLGPERIDDLLGQIHWADCVVGLGRTALEAMSAGRAVLVLDNRSYMEPALDGMVTPENLDALAARNFSGRAKLIRPSVDAIVRELSRYSGEMGPQNRLSVLRHFNVATVWQAYERLAVTRTGSA